ncbi:DUF5804 family protein [Halorientalis brevis]|uniref:DUF5804 family protein n=1 Tax=Halorientalis brevis TaxID=1126241 RepID=A0ABD6CI85_9EURY|nr:DUF5804 family protein [Halorientalis brevis]
MARVCIVGTPEANLRYELLSRETARNALATYDLREPFDNTVAVETVSLGAAVALLNDLNWYLVRFAQDVFVMEPSVSDTEWLSRDLAAALRDNEVEDDEAQRFLKIYGVADPDETENPTSEDDDPQPATDQPPRLVEPMFVTRTGRDLPEYDLREVEDTVTVRVTEAEFGGEKQR